MSKDPPYQPISCDFHDHLEATATRRTTVHIVYTDAEGRAHELDSIIDDLVSRDGEESMRLRAGVSIRLDRIVSVDGVRLPDDTDAGPDR